MNTIDLVGMVGAAYLEKRFAAHGTSGVARFVLDQLSEEECVGIVNAVRKSRALADKFLIKLPRATFGKHGLPDDLLTDERSTFFRNCNVKQPALLLAFVGDDEGPSLRELTPISAEDLRQEADLWVTASSDGLNLTETQCECWRQALRGLNQSQSWSLEALAEYVLAVREGVDTQGLAIVHALGSALPKLRIPRDSAYFNDIPEKTRTHAHRWKHSFQKALQDRACYLKKRAPGGQIIPNEKLEENWKIVQDDVKAVHHPAVEAFLREDPGWTEASSVLAECEYEDIKPLFDGLKRKERPALGQMTLDYYDMNEPGILKDDEKDLLRRLDDRRSTEANDEEKDFYDRHRLELKAKRPLKSLWENYVFGDPLECTDFFAGLLRTLERLFEQAGPTAKERRLEIEAYHSKRDVLDLNQDAAMYFATRYAGIEQLLGKKASWKLGSLMDFPDLAKKHPQDLKDSVARDALQIKFNISLVCKTAQGEEDHHQPLIWRFDPKTILTEFRGDLDRLAAHPLLLSRASREKVNQKGRLQYLDLADKTTFMAVYEKDRGSFVGVYDPEKDLAETWPAALDRARTEGRITEASSKAIGAAWGRFADAYGAALRGFLSPKQGIVCPELLRQAEAYEALLRELLLHGQGDRNRQDLLEPLLRIGTVYVDGGRPSCVVTPWHPLRLASIAVKARQLAGLLKHLLSEPEISFGDPRFFFSNLARDVGHPYHPEVAAGFAGKAPLLLAVSDTLADYSLLESPVRGKDAYDEANENPKDAADRIVGLVKRYIELQPHERANLSLALYNCDSARLPQATVEAIGALFEDEENVRCETHLRHSDASKLRELYQKIVEAGDHNADSFAVSESTRDFISGLRINIMADEVSEPTPLEGPRTDIVFLQDVVSRHADLRWEREPGDPVPLEGHFPPRWSRRRPAAKDDMRSVVYLTCPVQPAHGWAYIAAVRSLVLGEHADPDADRFLPARVVTFQNNTVDQAFKEVHKLGHWVVNYDEILDRRQLRNQGVRIIRFQQSTTQGRNLIVSSSSSLGLLKVLLVRKLKDLNLELSEQDLQELAERMFADANEVSGDIVLRAAKKGVFASELIGVVLSRYLLKSELGTGSPCGWYFLDDYAEWLGQREEQIADILAISPTSEAGETILRVLVSEAKYVEISGLAASRRESAKQLRDTVVRLDDALFGDPGRLDRDLWLSRIADLILDGMEFPATEVEKLAAWRRAIKEGRMKVLLRGYSHVFVPSAGDHASPREVVSVPKTTSCFQEVFGRDEVRELVLAYWNGNPDPTGIRARLGDLKPWTGGTAKLPAGRAGWLSGSNGGRPPAPDAPAAKPAVEVPAASEPDSARTATGQPPTASPKPEAAPLDDRWVWPGIGRIVSTAGALQGETDEAWLTQIARDLQGALQSYSLQAKVVSKRLTPNAALVKLAGSDRLRIEDIERRRTEFLTTHRLNIVSVSAEPGVVSVSVARPDRQVVPLLSAWKVRRIDRDQGGINSSLVVGVREDSGEILCLSPGTRHAPHTLIAGTTGSGKSVLMQNLILDIAATNVPELAKILLIDPKAGVDYFAFETLPHLSHGIVIDREAALAALQQIVDEMDQRYLRFRQKRVSKLSEYNAKVTPEERMPLRWVIHDEFAEWMMVEEYRDHVTQLVGRLGVKARAAGIFLIFAAQRPDANVMPMQLRDNLGNRLILRVESKGTSEIALGTGGAEHLLGKGHLAARLEGEPAIVYAQVPYLAPALLQQVVDTIRA